MKKKLFVILLSIFSILPILLTNNITYAQGDPCSQCEGITNSEDQYRCYDECTKIRPEDTTAGQAGINRCLTGLCTGAFDYAKMVGIKGVQKEGITAKTIVQDVIFAATYMVGTILAIVIIYCGLMYIFASRDGKDVSKYKKGLIYAAVGAILVRGAYAIVRLIQYIARG